MLNNEEEFKKKFKNIYLFTKSDINKFILLLRKVVDPHEYMNYWEKLNEVTIPEKENFYSNLSMENITEADNKHGKRVSNKF